MPSKPTKNLTNCKIVQMPEQTTMEAPDSDVESSQASLEEGEIPQSPPIPPQPAAPKKKSRWDIKYSNSGKKGYKSWRVHKAKILDCLIHSKGNLSFTRRYMLMHNGVLLPKNVIHYYANSYYRSQENKS
ncbi:22K [Bat mastadenovirus WIV12]|uniref:22K n=1 Tax=Bat mastadenovirus WIV12 TaxID=1788434 RepID=A0A1B0UI11_9ADEN|nr:22K [Bat mastadenovirus WIV12]AMB43162.1 22K [Bat mastadenovirus WIV12]